MVHRSKSNAERLFVIEKGIDGALNSEEIKIVLKEFNFPESSLLVGKEMVEKAKSLVSIQVQEHSEQTAATKAFQQHWSKSYSAYMITLKLARVVFKGQPDMLMRLKATGERKKSLSGWLNDARIFYTNMLASPEAIEKMGLYSYSAERLQKELDDVNEVEKLHVLQLAEKGEAQQSTVEKDKVLDELYNWYSDFRAIVRIAFYEKPQLLETLGIIMK
jgi:hypothetical protein